MASAKTFVDVPRFAVTRIDPKHKSRVVDLMTRTATAAVKGSGKLTLDEPKDGRAGDCSAACRRSGRTSGQEVRRRGDDVDLRGCRARR